MTENSLKFCKHVYIEFYFINYNGLPVAFLCGSFYDASREHEVTWQDDRKAMKKLSQ
jgi:hypothetical protein